MPWTLVSGSDGLPKVILTEPAGSSVEVLLYGGQVVSWKNDRREELLFMSTKATMKAPKAIRGGIPISFPQFGSSGTLEQHGFARNRLWELDGSPSPLSPPKSLSSVDLILKSTDTDLKTWPRSFELRVRIILTPGKLTLIPRVRNTDSKAFSFTFALRNYLSVSDVSEVRVEGLETLDYFDNLMQKERFTEQADAITFDGEVLGPLVPGLLSTWRELIEFIRRWLQVLKYLGAFCQTVGIAQIEYSGTFSRTVGMAQNYKVLLSVDRVYLSTPTKIAVIDHEKKRTLVLRKEGLPDAVLWNPWDKKAKALPDFGDEDYKAMLCVDSAVVETPIVLKPFEEWRGRQELSIVSSSYCSGQLDPRKVLFG